MTTPNPERLFQALDATWPAARILDAGPWKLREGLGGGQRVSAATPRHEICESDIEQAEEGMRALGQRPLFMLRREDEALDGWLAARGYDIVDPVTMYLAPVKNLIDDLPLTAAIPCWPPLAIQNEIWSAGGIGPARIAVMDRAYGPKTSVLGRRGETPGGTAFVAINDSIAMLHALEVAPSQRRKGIGKIIFTGCANWADLAQAEWMALAVTKANMAANALYQSMGIEPATSYHYRRAPETPV